jgi:hypothetical protein
MLKPGKYSWGKVVSVDDGSVGIGEFTFVVGEL